MRTVAVTLREDLQHIDHETLQQGLVAENGILDVRIHRGRDHTLTIDYDPSILTESRLLDSIYRHGVYPEPIPQRRTN